MKKKKIVFFSILGILIPGNIVAISYFIIINSTEISSWSLTLKDNEGDVILPRAISDNGDYIVAGSGNTKLYLFNKLESEPSWIFTANEDITSVDITPDGDYIVAGGAVNDLYLLNRSSPIPIWTHELDRSVSLVQISSDGKIIAASTFSRVYLFKSEEINPLINYRMMGCDSIDLSSDGKFLIASELRDDDGVIQFFNSSFSLPVWNFTIQPSGFSTPAWICSLTISSKGNYIAAGTQHDDFYLLNKSTSVNKTPIWSFHHPHRQAQSMSFSEDETLMVVGFHDGVYLFNPTDSIPLWNSSIEDGISSVFISENGKYIIAGSSIYSDEGFIYLFESNTSVPLWKYKFDKTLRSFQISPENENIITLIGDKLYFIDLENPKIDETFHNKLTLSYILLGVSIGASILIGTAYFIYWLKGKR